MTDDAKRGATGDRPMPALPPVDPAAVQPVAGDVSPEVFAGFLIDGDEELARWALGIAMRGRSRAEVYDTFVREAMRLVGEGWTAGRWTISEEHAASRTLARVLISVAPPHARAERAAPLAVLAGVAGEEHATGLMALDHVLREVGWATVDLGPDLPDDDLVRYCAKWEVALVALSASLADRLETIRDTVAALRALPRPPRIMVGGRIAEVADLSEVAPDWSGSSLREAARFAQAALEEIATATAES